MSPSFDYTEFFNSLNSIEKKFAPKQLFAEGDASFLSAALKISIVGTRKPTAQGIADAARLANTIVHHGGIVVSGLAEGIDTAAHETAIHAGGKTIAVLGTPLDIAYPAENKTLLEEIKTHHLAVSQFPCGSPISIGNFPLRNRTMALLSHATIIVEATERSGTFHMGWETLRLGRRLFLLPSVIENKAATSAKQMIKYGALKLTRHTLQFFLSTCQINRTFNTNLQP